MYLASTNSRPDINIAGDLIIVAKISTDSPVEASYSLPIHSHLRQCSFHESCVSVILSRRYTNCFGKIPLTDISKEI